MVMVQSAGALWRHCKESDGRDSVSVQSVVQVVLVLVLLLPSSKFESNLSLADF